MHKALLTGMEEHLRRLDRRLTRETPIVVIGGAALAFCWDPSHATYDVDLWNDPGREFWGAVDALKAFPDAVPIERACTASPPIDFEDRLIWVPIAGLKFLRLFAPEAHDLVLMKTVRGEAHDLEAAEAIHHRVALDLETLLQRYEETRSTLIGPELRFRGNFLALVARLFGEESADGIANRLLSSD